MELFELQAKIADISIAVGRRTKSGGRSIFLLTNWKTSVLRSRGGRNWSMS